MDLLKGAQGELFVYWDKNVHNCTYVLVYIRLWLFEAGRVIRCSCSFWRWGGEGMTFHTCTCTYTVRGTFGQDPTVSPLERDWGLRWIQVVYVHGYTIKQLGISILASYPGYSFAAFFTVLERNAEGLFSALCGGVAWARGCFYPSSKPTHKLTTKSQTVTRGHLYIHVHVIIQTNKQCSVYTMYSRCSLVIVTNSKGSALEKLTK